MIKQTCYLVYGLGKSGQSVVSFFADNGYCYHTYTDDDTERTFSLAEIDIVIKSPGVGSNSPFLEEVKHYPIEIISDLELWGRIFPSLMANSIVITGTCGKTSTVKLLELLLKTKYEVIVGGNIGVPLFALPCNEQAIYIIEASSYMLDYIKQFHPHIAIFLNFYPNHLDSHGSSEAYLAAKLKLAKNMNEKDLLIYNGEQAEFVQAFKTHLSQICVFARAELIADCYCDENNLYFKGEIYMRNWQDILNNSALQQNFLSIIGVLDLYGIRKKSILAKLTNYQAPEYRMNCCKADDELAIYNDAKSTNFLALKSAIAQLLVKKYRHLIIIIGGEDRGEKISDLWNIIPPKSQIIFTGCLGRRFFQETRTSFFIKYYQTLHEVFEKGLKRQCLPGSVILYSPAAPSFDQYSSYEKRGAEFNDLVERYYYQLAINHY